MKKKGMDVRFTVRGILIAMLIAVIVTACGSRKEFRKEFRKELERDVAKREIPLWQVLRHKRAGKENVVYKDKWFAYDIDLEYVKSAQADTLIASCPVAQAQFTVTDNESGNKVRSETVKWSTCNACHPR